MPRPSATLVLDPLRATVVAAKPLVLRRAQPATARGRSAAHAGSARPVVAPGHSPDAVAVAVSPRPAHDSGADAAPQHGGEGAPAPAPAHPPRPAPDRLLAPVGEAVGATGQAVGATTGSIGRRVDTITAAVGAAAGATGELLRGAAGASGRVVGRLLDGPPPR
jgi:hypothetical protein